MTHQLSLRTKPLTELLIPPNSSPIGSAGSENDTGAGAAAFLDRIDESRLFTGETAGAAGAGGHGAGGGAL